MARRALAAHGEEPRLVPSWRVVPFSVEMAGDVLLPGSDARIAPTTFDTWLPPSTPSVIRQSDASRNEAAHGRICELVRGNRLGPALGAGNFSGDSRVSDLRGHVA